MGEGALLIGFVALQRLAELMFVAGNTRRLIAAGGVEFGRADYPLIVALHAAWLGGLWMFGRAMPVDPWWLVGFAMVEAGRFWVIATLGRRWTARVIVVPGEKLIQAGPYRWLRHPNYLVVVLEIAVAPLALGLPWFALAFTLLNAAVLTRRIAVENRALALIAAREDAG